MVLLVGTIASGVALAAGGDATPVLGFADSVPDDLRELATQTWHTFRDAHPGRQGCIGAPTLEAAWELDTRAEYRPEAAAIVVRVPGTPATLRNQIVHELAHHLEFTCPDQVELRVAFLEAQGFPPGAPWFEGDTWEATPSEQYAEATIEMVLGRRSHHGNVQVSDRAIEVVRRWATGS